MEIYMKLAEYAAMAPEEEFNRFLSYLEECRDNGELPEEVYNGLLKIFMVVQEDKNKPVYGTYAVKIENLFLCVNGNAPAITCLMRVLDGERAGDLVSIRQCAKNGFQVHGVNEFLRQLCGLEKNPPEIRFKTFAQYGELIDRVFTTICNRYEYIIRLYDNCGYTAYEVEGIGVCP